MKKSKNIDLSWEETQKLILMAQNEKKPFEAIKQKFNVDERQVLEIMKKNLAADNYVIWKKKADASKPKPKPIKFDDFDDDLDGKYYIKNKLD